MTLLYYLLGCVSPYLFLFLCDPCHIKEKQAISSSQNLLLLKNETEGNFTVPQPSPPTSVQSPNAHAHFEAMFFRRLIAQMRNSISDLFPQLLLAILPEWSY
jgi:hypothetical protein